MNRLLLIFLLLSLALTSCDSDTIDPQAIPDGKSYVPVEIGQFWEYRVERVSYTEFEAPESSQYFLREVVADTFRNLTSQLTYRLERSRRVSETANWQLDSVWVAWREPNRWVRVENNTPVIRLVFPFEDNKVWDGNALNTNGKEMFTLDSLNRFFDTDNNSFFPTVRVIQSADSSLINKDVRWEVYADSIGLVYRYHQVIQYVNDTESPDYGKDSITGGLFYRQTLLRWGKQQ